MSNADDKQERDAIVKAPNLSPQKASSGLVRRTLQDIEQLVAGLDEGSRSNQLDNTITVTLPGDVQMEFVYIPPGTFLMGSPEDDIQNYFHRPQHQVAISKGFYLGKYEVTQRQWIAVMETVPWQGKDSVKEDSEHPAVFISWNDIHAFVNILNQSAGYRLYQLPTEAEWEYACRAGTTTRWSFGDEESKLGDYAWYFGNALGRGEPYAHKVGTKLPNPWGLHDMHGNVGEWVQDWSGNYTSVMKVNPIGPESGSHRVIRGGDFAVYSLATQSAVRFSDMPDSKDLYTGFRLLRRADALKL